MAVGIPAIIGTIRAVVAIGFIITIGTIRRDDHDRWRDHIARGCHLHRHHHTTGEAD
jgi:hypothetical protein